MSTEIVVPWHAGQSGFWWNETCAMVIKVFGLPEIDFDTVQKWTK